jgi:CRISPR-associated endoribonuclease Cas6
MHDKTGYKFFCFSNIFPARDLIMNDLRTLLISSPNKEFIEYLYRRIECMKIEITIGSMRFAIDSVNKLDIKIPHNVPFTLITGTPIIVRIPKAKYKLHGINPKNDYNYLYWRIEHPIELFVSQIQNNLSKKYNEYYRCYEDNNNYNKDFVRPSMYAPSFANLFEKFRFIKQVSTKLVIRGSEQTVIGSVWEFGFEGWQDSKLIQFVLDSGLGERNSLGFGYMNIKLEHSVYG